MDERGITLQTVIVTAVMALIAAGAGVVIYNAIRSGSGDIDARAGAAQNVPSLFMTDADGNLVPATSTTVNPFTAAGNLPPVVIPIIPRIPIEDREPRTIVTRYDNGSVDTRTIFPDGRAKGIVTMLDGSSHEYEFPLNGEQIGTWRQVEDYTAEYRIRVSGEQTGNLMHEAGITGMFMVARDRTQTGTLIYPSMGETITFIRKAEISEDGRSSKVITMGTFRKVVSGKEVFLNEYTAVETYMREVFPDKSVTEVFVSLAVTGTRTFENGVVDVYEDRPNGITGGTRTYPDGLRDVYETQPNGMTAGIRTHTNGLVERYRAPRNGMENGIRTFPDGVVEAYRVQDGIQTGTRTFPNGIIEMYEVQRDGTQGGTRTYPDGRMEEF